MDISFIAAYPYAVIAGILALGLFVLAVLYFDLRRKWRTLFGGKADTRAGVFEEVLRRQVDLERHVTGFAPRLLALEAVAPATIRKMGFIRFNPFAHTGGDQSFALALLDSEHNGIVLSSLYTREGVRVYAKEIVRGVSKQPLSDEEKQALDRAVEHPDTSIT